MKVFGCFVALFAVCSAHMCLLEPRQRGSLVNINKAGSNDCILTMAPCGGRPSQLAKSVWESAGNYSVIFQKNLDHWVQATPGYFSVSYMSAPGTTPIELTRIADKGEPSLSLYTASGTLPTIEKGDIILQVTYVTKNAQAPPVFYQCADVTIA